MFKINNLEFNGEVVDVINTLRFDLAKNNINLFSSIKPMTNYISVTCPYHKSGAEKKPSAGFRKDNGYFSCFTCQEKHSLPEVIGYCFGKDKAFGIEWLKDNFLFDEYAVNDRADKMVLKKKTEKKKISYIENKEIDKYRKFHPYMFERKLTKDVIRKYDIGYDKDSDCIVFPNKDEKGNILFLAKRSVKSKFFNYPKDVEKPIYGLYELKRDFPNATYVIVCESMLDALVFIVAGKPAVALNGTGSSEQLDKLNKLPYRKIILCTDMDEAGLKARNKIARKLKNKFIYEYILPEGKKDANDCDIEELKSLKETLFKERKLNEDIQQK